MDTESIEITPELLGLISEIDEFKGAWRAFGTLAPERLNALRRVATIESIGSSSRIEGSKLSDREVEHLLARLEVSSFASRDEQEVAGYAGVMETIFQSWQDIALTENHTRMCLTVRWRASSNGARKATTRRSGKRSGRFAPMRQIGSRG